MSNVELSVNREGLGAGEVAGVGYLYGHRLIPDLGRCWRPFDQAGGPLDDHPGRRGRQRVGEYIPYIQVTSIGIVAVELSYRGGCHRC